MAIRFCLVLIAISAIGSLLSGKGRAKLIASPEAAGFGARSDHRFNGTDDWLRSFS
jgi:hypothetical protein